MNPTQQLHAIGQSLWLDNITKELISSGTLARYIDEFAITGLTSNPTILEKAISTGNAYDTAILEALQAGISSSEELVFHVALEDLRAAAERFLPAYTNSNGTDGFVSVEVSPALAHDAEGTIAAARHLHAQANCPNIMIKVPGTAAGIVAIEQIIGDGIPVNVTLLFSADQYRAAAEAYLRGIERRLADGNSLIVASVASVFVSRWDVAADAVLPEELHGTTALAVMQQVYEQYQEILASSRWETLQAAGAFPQRVLWASTGTKNPAFSDTYYLTPLAAPRTVNTIPESTLLAFADHGEVGEVMRVDAPATEKALAAVTAAGVDLDKLAVRLQEEGADAFQTSWDTLLEVMNEKVARLSVS